MDSQGFYASPKTHYGNGDTNSGDAFGGMGQDTMQQAQKTNVGAAFGSRMGQSVMQPSQITDANVVFDPATSQKIMQQPQTTNGRVAFGIQNVMQQSQTTNAGQFNSSRPNRLLQLQEHQQQQRSNALPEKALGSPATPSYGVGACVKRVTEYMLWLRNRPQNNSITFWRKFVGEFYAPNAKKRLCVSMYDAHKIAGVLPQESWRCEICNRKPGHGLEANAEILPRLFKIKFESGALEEFMYINVPRGYSNSSGQIVLEYGKAIQESVFDQIRVVRDGHLRVVFSQNLKICSWEFCATRHEELVPRRLLVPKICKLGSAAQMYRAATTATASSSSSASHIHSSCNLLVDSASQLAEAFKTPLVNELGYSKRYIRSIQISEVVNSMKDLIDQFWVTGTGPIESLSKYSRRGTKRPLSEQPSTPNKKKPLDFPPGAFQLMCNSIMNPYGTSSVSNAAQFTGHRGTTFLRSRGPRNSTNSPSAITYTTPSTPSTLMPPPSNMSTAYSTNAMLFGQSKGSGGSMDVGAFGTDTIFIDDDLLPSGSNICAPSGPFQNDPWESNTSSVFGGVDSSKGKSTFQGEPSSSAIRGNIDGMGGLMGKAIFQGEASSSSIGVNLIPMDGSMGQANISEASSSAIGGSLTPMDGMSSLKCKATFQGEASSSAIGANLISMDVLDEFDGFDFLDDF